VTSGLNNASFMGYFLDKWKALYAALLMLVFLPTEKSAESLSVLARVNGP
jgi:hypothetical protein